MVTKTFTGLLEHKNPICPECHVLCFSLYEGGKKDKIKDLFTCRNCKTIYKIPSKGKCEFTEAN